MCTTNHYTLKTLLKEEVVRLNVDGITTPEEAIRYSGNLLKEAGKVNGCYVEDMVSTYHTLGAYFVLAPGIAMPHARPGDNVMENAVSFVQLKTPIKFQNPDNDPVKLVIALAGISDNGHMELLQDLGHLLQKENMLDKLSNINGYDELINLMEEAKK